MILTPRAERLVNPLRISLAALRKVLETDAGMSHPSSVSIMMRDQFVVALAPAILRRLAQESAETTLNIVPYDRDRLRDDLVRGAIDAAVSVDPPATPGLMGTLLYQESFVCLTPHRDAPTLREYIAARHVATTSHSGYVGIDAALAKKGLARRIVAHVPYFAALIHVAEAHGLYATVPRRVVLAIPPKTLFVHPVPIAIPGFRVTLVWDRRCDQDATNRWLRGLIVDVARTLPRRQEP